MQPNPKVIQWVMAYFCTFDLKDASSTDYQNAYADLEKLGLYKAQDDSSGGKTVIPTTTVLGFYNGASAAAIRGDVRSKVKVAFSVRGCRSEIFVVVGVLAGHGDQQPRDVAQQCVQADAASRRGSDVGRQEQPLRESRFAVGSKERATR